MTNYTHTPTKPLQAMLARLNSSQRSAKYELKRALDIAHTALSEGDLRSFTIQDNRAWDLRRQINTHQPTIDEITAELERRVQ